jgi:hypothetical protein
MTILNYTLVLKDHRKLIFPAPAPWNQDPAAGENAFSGKWK